MARYPVKMLKDEQNQPFVPMVSAESIYTNDDKSFEEKFATKLESKNLKGSDSITITRHDNDCIFEVNFGATDNIIDNLDTTVAGQGPLDARQGNVLKNMIPTIVDNLDSTDATKVLSANQGHELKEMSVPTGGATGQVLKKASNNDHELEWGDAADPNAIVGDGSIMKIIELTYAEYKTLESNGGLKEDTEYHITDVENGTSSYMTEQQIDDKINTKVQEINKNNIVDTIVFDNEDNYELVQGYTTKIIKNGICFIRFYMATVSPATSGIKLFTAPRPLLYDKGAPHWQFHAWEQEPLGDPIVININDDGGFYMRKGVAGKNYFVNLSYPINE